MLMALGVAAIILLALVAKINEKYGIGGGLIFLAAIIAAIVFLLKWLVSPRKKALSEAEYAKINKMIQALSILIELETISLEDGEGGSLFNACCVRGNSIQLHFKLSNSSWAYCIRHWNEFDTGLHETKKEYFESVILAKAIKRAKEKGISITENTLSALNILIEIDPDSADPSISDDLFLSSCITVPNNLPGYCFALKRAIEEKFPENLRDNAKVRLFLYI